jgi:hypothetical protein
VEGVMAYYSQILQGSLARMILEDHGFGFLAWTRMDLVR